MLVKCFPWGCNLPMNNTSRIRKAIEHCFDVWFYPTVIFVRGGWAVFHWLDYCFVMILGNNFGLVQTVFSSDDLPLSVSPFISKCADELKSMNHSELIFTSRTWCWFSQHLPSVFKDAGSALNIYGRQIIFHHFYLMNTICTVVVFPVILQAVWSIPEFPQVKT